MDHQLELCTPCWKYWTLPGCRDPLLDDVRDSRVCGMGVKCRAAQPCCRTRVLSHLSVDAVCTPAFPGFILVGSSLDLTSETAWCSFRFFPWANLTSSLNIPGVRASLLSLLVCIGTVLEVFSTWFWANAIFSSLPFLHHWSYYGICLIFNLCNVESVTSFLLGHQPVPKSWHGDLLVMNALLILGLFLVSSFCLAHFSSPIFCLRSFCLSSCMSHVSCLFHVSLAGSCIATWSRVFGAWILTGLNNKTPELGIRVNAGKSEKQNSQPVVLWLPNHLTKRAILSLGILWLKGVSYLFYPFTLLSIQPYPFFLSPPP